MTRSEYSRPPPAEIQEHWDLLTWLSNQPDALTEKLKPFLKFSRPWAQRLKIVGFAVLSFVLSIGGASAESPSSPSTTTAVFHLRSECAVLGEKILDTKIVGAALSKSQTSLYNPQTNRSYVELTVQTADTTKTLSLLRRYLFDGQTGEMLTYAETKNSQPWSGMVFDQSHDKTTFSNAGWDDANAYISAIMADDRKQ
jgi:hypothetical protein